MEPECGAPVFDNIDDVLAERIVNHSRTHSDRTEPPFEDDMPPPLPPVDYPGSSGLPKGLLIGGMIVLALMMLLYRIVYHHSRR